MELDSQKLIKIHFKLLFNQDMIQTEHNYSQVLNISANMKDMIISSKNMDQVKICRKIKQKCIIDLLVIYHTLSILIFDLNLYVKKK